MDSTVGFLQVHIANHVEVEVEVEIKANPPSILNIIYIVLLRNLNERAAGSYDLIGLSV